MKETIAKMNKAKSSFFEKVNKIDKSLARLCKKKMKTQVNKIRNENEETTADNIEIQRIIKDYELTGNHSHLPTFCANVSVCVCVC